ncbi:hypothetical protein [Vibrio coralliirubri]|uniref:hypothetical protein n=1 Tax=Vibrio coralliirubri TaxID=1516159 RepID=UPI000A3C116C|nr:hypothetical protein [Vibrio coralliirubri]
MTTLPVNLNVSLHKILVVTQLDNFSVIELRDRFLSMSTLSRSKDDARRYVYRNILRLEKLKLLRRTYLPASKKAIYKKECAFFEVIWNVTNEPRGDKNSLPSHPKTRDKICSLLEKRLDDCQSRYLSYQNEHETYKNLTYDFPILATTLSEPQKDTAIKTLKLDGEIRAIEMALALSR